MVKNIFITHAKETQNKTEKTELVLSPFTTSDQETDPVNSQVPGNVGLITKSLDYEQVIKSNGY